jgi:L-amino acid N-acyltransferase YncA
MWEYEVQQAMRGTVIPSLQSDRFMRLGLDGEGLATVVLWEELEGPGRVLVHAAAVALRAQGRGYGNAMLTDALDEMTGRAVNAGLPTLTVGARVFHQNSASQAMCRRAQGAPTGESYPTGADEWGLVLLLT